MDNSTEKKTTVSIRRNAPTDICHNFTALVRRLRAGSLSTWCDGNTTDSDTKSVVLESNDRQHL